jgi:hypothetical protein
MQPEDSNSTPPDLAPEPGVTTPPEPQVQQLSKKSKLPLLISLAVLLIAGGVYGYMQMNKDDAQDSKATDTPAQVEVANGMPGVPNNLVYAEQNSEEKTTKLVWKKIGNSESTVAKEFGEGHYINNLGVHGTLVYAVVSNPETEQVWYSSDEGKSYAKVYEGKPNVTDSGMGDQITSAIFSSSGEELLISVLAAYTTEEAMAYAYTTKQITLKTGDTKDLFTTDSPIILKGYSNKDSKVYYVKANCWNCDGGLKNSLYTYDLSANSESSWDNQNDEISEAFLNHDLTKALIITGQPGDGVGLGEPYGMYEVTLSDKKVSPILTNSDTYLSGGYSLSNKVLYERGTKLMTVGTEATTYESSENIVEILFANEDELILRTKSQENENDDRFRYVIYKKADNKTEELLLAKGSDVSGLKVTYVLP